MVVSVEEMQEDIVELADMVTDLKECVEKLTKAVEELTEDNKHLYEELKGKNIFIEDLLRQMIGGAVNSIGGSKREIKSDSSEPIKPVSKSMQDYIAKKNGGLKLPG